MPSPTRTKSQRILDPLHQLIEFAPDQFEHTLWKVIQTSPFQRLRRIRQLGFSEFVFPGATHTRFAHSLGVFHTARQLMGVLQRHIREGSGPQYREHQAHVALAAALVHDVGHGMFSHAFEEVGKSFNLPMAKHEAVSVRLIQDGEISEVFRELGSGFANDVAELIDRGQPGNLYDAVVSSQFDADRLDYMQRDRMMSGVQSSGIDAGWLMANLEIASIPMGADEERGGQVETLVVGPKAYQAAEGYVLSLFQLYPTLYLHKTTRAAEKVFSTLLRRLVNLCREDRVDEVGLSATHPLVRFAKAGDDLLAAQSLDDLVFWGAVPLMMDAKDRLVRECATRLFRRKLPKCIDIRRQVETAVPLPEKATREQRVARNARIQLTCERIVRELGERPEAQTVEHLPVLIDQTKRQPYKRFQDSRSLLNQILIRQGPIRGEGVIDMAELSPVVAGAELYEVCRAYVADDDSEAREVVENILRTEMERGNDDGP